VRHPDEVLTRLVRHRPIEMLAVTPANWVTMQADYDTRLEQQTHADELDNAEILVQVA
jgi:hypothetical protein